MKKAIFITAIISLSSLLTTIIGTSLYASSPINSGAEALGFTIQTLFGALLGLSYLILATLSIVNYFVKSKDVVVVEKEVFVERIEK